MTKLSHDKDTSFGFLSDRCARWFDQFPRTGEIVETSEAVANHALEALPPIYAKGCFGLGEPLSHDWETGEAISNFFAQIDGRWYGTIGTKKQAEERFELFKVALRKIQKLPEVLGHSPIMVDGQIWAAPVFASGELDLANALPIDEAEGDDSESFIERIKEIALQNRHGLQSFTSQEIQDSK